VRLRTILAWATTLVWAAFIFELSTATFSSSFTAWLLGQLLRLMHLEVTPAVFATLHHLIRKLAHLTEYMIFSLLLYHCFEGTRPHEWRTRLAFWAILAAALYSLTDEYHQSLVRERTASLIDCGIDTAGAALGMLVLYGHERVFHAKNNRTPASSESMAEMKKGAAGL